MAGSFRAELAKKSTEPVDVHEVSLDTAKAQSPSDQGPFVEYIRALASGRKFDLIVPIGAPAFFFIQRYRQQLFPKTPMVIVGADRRRIPGHFLSENDTTVLLNLDLPAYLKNILRLRPETTEIGVVVGNSPVERYWTSELQRDFHSIAGKVNITWFNDLTFPEMLSRAASMPPQSVIFWFLLSEDAAGVPYSQDRALETMREITNVPIFGMGDYEMGRGIVGGPLMDTQALGRQGAEVVLRILKGEAPGRINSPDVLFGPPAYDWRELRRWNISESRLPPGSVIQYPEASIWVQYRWQILVITTILWAQATGIIWLFVERRRRQRAEVDLRQRLSEVIHLNRTALTGALSASVAHELNQPLGAIQSYAEAASLYLKSDPPNVQRVEEILGNIRRDDKRAADIISHLRGLLKKRDEGAWQEFDVNDAVRESLQVVGPEASKRGLELKAVAVDRSLPVCGDPVHLQQVILNLAMNGMDAMQTCAPGEGRMSIETAVADGNAIEVSIADCGPGIPQDKIDEVFEPFYTTKGNGTGLGLSIARTIVETYGGKIWAENRPGGGAAFRFTLPLAREPVA